MFNLTRILGFRHGHGSPRHRTGGDEDEGKVRLLVITSDLGFYSNLSDVAAGCDCDIRRVATVEEAIPVLTGGSIPVVVYDWNAAGGDDWRHAFNRLRALEAHVCILLASQTADQYFWQEVIRLGGFDLLSRSAPRDELIHKLQFAWFWNKTSQQAPNRH